MLNSNGISLFSLTVCTYFCRRCASDFIAIVKYWQWQSSRTRRQPRELNSRQDEQATSCLTLFGSRQVFSLDVQKRMMTIIEIHVDNALQYTDFAYKQSQVWLPVFSLTWYFCVSFKPKIRYFKPRKYIRFLLCYRPFLSWLVRMLKKIYSDYWFTIFDWRFYLL